MNEHYQKMKRRFAREKEKRPHAPITVQHNLHLWQDIHFYFRRLFESKPNLIERTYTPDALINDLEAFFKGRYDRVEIEKMCKMGYKEVRPGEYQFMRSDFIIEKN
ncbi:MAG TPA: hypothetical protein VGM41_08295 [Chitinophagaceae bacterium]|jgi:hypothetical protein